MTMDNVSLKEYSNGTYGRDSRISSNRLKLRNSSFENATSKWRKFLRKILEEKLSEEKTKLVQSEYKTSEDGDLTSSDQIKISNITSKIAKLEKIISVLSRDNIPKNYVKRRAIKLRKAMFDYMKENGIGIYKIDNSDKKQIFENARVNTIPTPSQKIVTGNATNYVDYNYIYKGSKIDSKPEEIDVKEVSDLTRNNIASDINKAMDEVKDQNTQQETINREQIIEAIDSHYGNVYKSTNGDYGVSDISQQEDNNEHKTVIASEPVNEINLHDELIRDNVVVIDDTRNNSIIESNENKNTQQEIVEADNNKFKISEPKDESFNNDEEKSVLQELEELSIAFEDFEKSESEFNETNKRVKQEEDEAQKVTQEKIEGKNRQKELIEKIQKAREEYIQKAKENRASVASMNESIDKTRKFIESERLAINNYNNQISKMNAALEKLSSKDLHQSTPSTTESIQNTINTSTSSSFEIKNNYHNLQSEPPAQIDSDLDEAFRIINDVDNSTLTQLRWARDVIDFSDRYTKPEKISAENNGVLDSYGVMHAPSSYFGVPTPNNNTFEDSYNKGR